MIYHNKFLLTAFIVLSMFACRYHKVNIIPVSDFFNSDGKSYYHLSPDGKFVSYIDRANGKQNIIVQNIIDGKERVVSQFPDFSPRDYFWTYNNQIVYGRPLFKQDKFELFGVDVNTLQTHMIMSAGKVSFRVLSRKTSSPDVITCTMNLRDSSTFDVYRMNTKTGETKVYIRNPGNVTEWFPDADGRIRLAKSSDGVNEAILFRQNDAAKFKPIIVNNFKNTVSPIAFTGDRNYFYARSNVKQDKMALVAINAENIKDEKQIFATPKGDIDEVMYTKSKHRLEGVAWQEAKPQRHFLDAHLKAIYDDLLAKLPGNEIRIADRDSSENLFLINTYSDRNPGAYYLYNVNQRTITKLTDLNPKINPADLCEMKPIQFKAGDGTLINGYLTLPKDADPVNLPVVVIPHTDAWRRNNWDYNPDVQFLANRGYAVLQVNYRGSKGYGKAFYSAGFKQVGGKMQQDITDGVKWLIARRIANPRKIAIFGTGFGGFSALYGVSFFPGLYHCAAIQNGLINMFTYVKDVPPFFKPMLKMRYEMVGNPDSDADEFRAISPVFYPRKIKVPLLIVQDMKDPHSNISELDQYVSELKKNGVKVNYISRNREHRGGKGHDNFGGPNRGFFRGRDKTQMYTELENFLAVNLLDKQ